ncbi:mediator of RNA polymerase II transcription subunit 13 [Neocucurbitaria cava]|uniref:Mediator of RNA polymerase II transcription subunit 13 n=1 Tax=Neocucurbitaria cava TaxID=798079 RepID=A0A9W9CRK3_9PLEO|nr:mediator of RNA polymerase II transcription subunit 13 [Neocucurbitaria cava]
MEFLKTCSTNAQAIGDFEAVAYQALSSSRSTTQPSLRLHDGSPSEDIRAIEAELRQGLSLVIQDVSRPWLWLFQPSTVDKAEAGQGAVELPELDGYCLQREQSGFIKATELSRPPLRALNSTPSSGSNISFSTASHKVLLSGGARPSQGSSQSQGTDSSQPPDCFTLYDLFTSSVIALISFHLVRDCSVVALNHRTFVSQPLTTQGNDNAKPAMPPIPHWLTGINVHWISSGTLLVSTFTNRNPEIRCVADVTLPSEQELLVGRCVRVAPNGLLARIASFEDPLDSLTEEVSQRPRKRAKIGSLEQSIEKWKSTVKRWLGWRGYSLPNLEKRSSWVRLRTGQMNQSTVSSPAPSASDRDIIWPRALCFYYFTDWTGNTAPETSTILTSEPADNDLRWYETPDSTGFRDPLDVAQQWFLGKPNRDKILEARRKAKKAEEEAARRKEDRPSLYASSPLNARNGAYGDFQSVSGVYPTPPDGVVPGTAVSYSDTPSVSGGTSNIILAPGGNNPAINLSAPQDNGHSDAQQLPMTSPVFPSGPDNFNTSSGNDDLFEDMEEDGYGGNGVNDADFDFFDGPDEEDVDMVDASALPDDQITTIKDGQVPEPMAISEQVKEEMPDHLAALENALATASEPTDAELPKIEGNQPPATPFLAQKQGDTSMEEEEEVSPQAHRRMSTTKEPTPPLSPGMIAKTLQPSPPNKSTSQNLQDQKLRSQRDSAFDPLIFSRKMSISDAKYHDGLSSVQHDKNINDRQASPAPCRTKSLRDMPLLTKLRYAIGVASANRIPEIPSLARAVSDDSDSSSESSDSSEEDSEEEATTGPEALVGGIILPAKRRLPTEGNATPMSVTSFAESLGSDWHDLQGLQLDEAALAFFEPDTWDWSLVMFPSPSERAAAGARYNMPALSPSNAQMPDTPTSQSDFTPEQPDEKPLILSGKDSIAITQIVTDQIVSATLDILGEDQLLQQDSNYPASPETRWQATIRNIFPNATECNLPTLAAVHDVFPELSAQAKGQQRPPPRKPNEGAAIPGNHLFPLNPPFLRVRRAETHWDLLPPAIAFWEPLGLSPISSPKNIVTFCVYPHSESLRPCLENLLLNLQLAYDSCKLGSHARVETVVEFEGGLVPCRVTTPGTRREAIKVLRETCVQLGKLLAIQHGKIREQQDSKIDAFVIYMVDSFGGPSGLWELGSAFWALFQAYSQGVPGRPDQPQKPDLVLQVIPMKYIASFDVPVILDPSTYINLAREVYDRCPPSAPSGDKTTLSIYKAPAFQLEETLPRTIPFRLISEPAQDLLRENSYMHLGYAISLDGNWITAAWTDSCGKSQAVVSYHLGTRVFAEIAKEIWQTTIEILQSRRVHWRVVIAKAGVVERDEFETWVSLISYPTQLNVFIMLFTVDTDPPFKLTPSMTPTHNPTTGQPSANSPDPASQAGVSPDPAVGLTPAATPSADPTTTTTDPSADPEARLIDVTDESWGVILAHRLHNSNSTNQFNPALISGLLVKRGETFATSNTINHPIPDPQHGPIVVAVNMLWIGAVGSNTRASAATSSPLPSPSAGTGSDGVSPGSSGVTPNPYATAATTGAGSASAPPSPSPATTQQDGGVRAASSLIWAPTVQTRSTAENLLREVLVQYRALGLLAKLRGVRGSRHGSVPWHVAAAKRGVGGLERVVGGGGGSGG